MSKDLETINIEITVNGKVYRRDVEPRLLLVEFIRENLALTGTHIGCDTSFCGACTIILNGEAIKSCTYLAVQADGGEIITVEGLEQDNKLHPLQQAFSECHGLQCGYCTPGMLMSSLALLAENPRSECQGYTQASVRQCLSLYRLHKHYQVGSIRCQTVTGGLAHGNEI